MKLFMIFLICGEEKKSMCNVDNKKTFSPKQFPNKNLTNNLLSF